MLLLNFSKFESEYAGYRRYFERLCGEAAASDYKMKINKTKIQ